MRGCAGCVSLSDSFGLLAVETRDELNEVSSEDCVSGLVFFFFTCFDVELDLVEAATAGWGFFGAITIEAVSELVTEFPQGEEEVDLVLTCVGTFVVGLSFEKQEKVLDFSS